MRIEQVSRTRHSGKVYCAETPTGFFLVRRNGKAWATGNSGRLCQVQNLPQNHIPDLALARSLVKRGEFDQVEMLYDSTPGVLSELIRTAFVPKPGCRFIVADFAAIEARVLAWFSGEQWRLDTFQQGGDIYCASACQRQSEIVRACLKSPRARLGGIFSVLTALKILAIRQDCCGFLPCRT